VQPCRAPWSRPARSACRPRARVASATFLAAGGAGAKARPAYCKVLAQIAPVDPRAQPITVELNLPSAWNGKAVQMGGGGLDGFLVTADGPGPGASAQPTPLSIGYATFGSDGGHSVASPFDADGQTKAFMNDEVLANYGGAQLKKTHDLAMALIRLRYGKAPRRTYFVGGSEGGNEALAVAQRWGEDYDGAISYYPAAGGVPLVAALGRDARALAAPGAYPNPAKQALLHQAVVAACDADDGAADGIVSNPTACAFNVASLRCPTGGDEGDSCLSDAQIAALKVMNTDVRLSYPLASGETGIAGYRVFQGVDLTAHISGLGASAPAPGPLAPTAPIHYMFFNVFVRGFVMRDANADALAFDPENPGAWASRMSQISSIIGSSRPDLSRFSRHGGKRRPDPGGLERGLLSQRGADHGRGGGGQVHAVLHRARLRPWPRRLHRRLGLPDSPGPLGRDRRRAGPARRHGCQPRDPRPDAAALPVPSLAPLQWLARRQCRRQLQLRETLTGTLTARPAVWRPPLRRADVRSGALLRLAPGAERREPPASSDRSP